MITPSFGITATERVLPRLALDFTTATLDPRVTFTRTTGASNPATFVNSNGAITAASNNQPRFDYDPVTLACKGLLVEESRANFLPYSQDLSQTGWVAISSTLGANGISPDATANASNVVEDTVTNFHGYYQNITYAAQTYTLSAYVKRSSGTRNFSFRVRTTVLGGTIIGIATFDLTNGAVLGATTGTASIQNAGGGWYRCFLTFTGTAANYWTNFLIVDGTTASYTGDGASGLYIWGAQLEAGAFATSYIPTTSAALTRNADVATMTGTNFSDWFNASEGTFETVSLNQGVAQNLKTATIFVDTLPTTNYMSITTSAVNVARLRIMVSGVDQITSTISASGSVVDLVAAYKTNDCVFGSNGFVTAVDTSCGVPSSLNKLQLGFETRNSSYMNSHLQKFNYYPQRLTTSEVQAFSKG